MMSWTMINQRSKMREEITDYESLGGLLTKCVLWATRTCKNRIPSEFNPLQPREAESRNIRRHQTLICTLICCCYCLQMYNFSSASFSSPLLSLWSLVGLQLVRFCNRFTDSHSPHTYVVPSINGSITYFAHCASSCTMQF